MSNASKEIVARLLATENITVLHENIPTAAFNVKERTLHLPLWEDMDDDTYSHLIGHEVGHALYTPEEGWHDAVCDRGQTFKQFLNVIEDARIEKLVQRRYPGLRRSFIKSYKKMLADGFFGADIDQINGGHLIDRINTYFKCGLACGIKFDSTERHWIDEINSAETWEQVEDIANRLFEFAREQAKQKVEEQEEQQQQMLDESDDSDEEELMSNSEYDYDEGNTEDSRDQYGDAPDWEMDDEDDPTAEVGQGSVSQMSQDEKIEREMRSETDEQLRKSIDAEYGNMVDGEVKNAMFRPFDIQRFTYKDVFAEIEKELAEELDGPWNNTYRAFTRAGLTLWQDFARDNKRVVNHMVKEFEMRKKAAEYVRASTAKTGVIDNVKMNNYKLTDDIFKKITIVPEGKNHGFLIWLDLSGSMCDCIFDATGQALTLAMFCRQANIPFKFMTFTSNWTTEWEPPALPDGTVVSDPSTCVVEIFNDKMRKSEFALMAQYMLSMAYCLGCTRKLYNKYGIYRHYRIPKLLGMGGTPLNECILASVKLHDDFKTAYRLDKVNTFFISDGESATFSVVRSKTNYDGETWRMPSDFSMWGSHRDNNIFRIVDEQTGRRYRMMSGTYDARMNQTNQCLRLYRDRTGSTTIGYFIVSHTAREATYVSERYDNNSQDVWDNLRKNNLAEITGSGYDQFFLISKKGLHIESGDLEVKGDVTKGKLRTAFRKSQGNKKASRELTNRIMELVA